MTSIDTVNDLPPRVQYVASAAQTDFDYPFPIFVDTDLVVYVDTTLKTLTTHYTVSGEGDDEGGTVTFLSGMVGGEVITIYRDMAIERTTDFQQNGEFSTASFNDELDRLVLIMQDTRSRLNRAIRFPIAGTVATDAQLSLDPISNWSGKYLYINASGVLEAVDYISEAEILAGVLADSRISESSVTQHEAALSILETQIADGSLLARLAANETVAGTWTFSNAVALGAASTVGGISVGFLGLPRLSGAGGTAATTWKGKCYATTAGVTIPNATFAAGDAFVIYNDTSGNLTITQGASLTQRLHGSATTGNLTLAQRGFATVWFNTASEAVLSGDVS